ncbi:MAG: NADH-quinone oxidoreductase subunit C [Spirochaetia bacterium]|nr:NADH-quinone oxidoreductase subunit C [Spirochaetia bacterium]
MRGQNPEKNQELLKQVQLKLGKFVSLVEENHGMVVAHTQPDKLLSAMKELKENPLFNFDVLIDLTSVDYLGKRDVRFEMVYMLLSSKTLSRIRIKAPVAENEEVPSLIDIWKGANWPEREVFDLMGIRFSKHPLMERLIMPDGYIGHPLRKDFPVKGRGEDYLIESILRPVKKEAGAQESL